MLEGGGHVRMRRNSHVIRAEAAVEAQQAFVLGDLLEAVEHAVVRERAVRCPRLLLQPRLHEIKGERQEGCEEAGDGARGQCL